MNNYWDHEPEFFWYKKNVRKSQKFLTQRSDPPPSSRFFEKISDVIFLRPLTEKFQCTFDFEMDIFYWIQVIIIFWVSHYLPPRLM